MNSFDHNDNASKAESKASQLWIDNLMSDGFEQKTRTTLLKTDWLTLLTHDSLKLFFFFLHLLDKQLLLSTLLLTLHQPSLHLLASLGLQQLLLQLVISAQKLTPDSLG